MAPEHTRWKNLSLTIHSLLIVDPVRLFTQDAIISVSVAALDD